MVNEKSHVTLKLWMAVTFVIVAVQFSPTRCSAEVNRWSSFGSVRAMYQCCCPENPACGGCFMCRQQVFACFCETCSCYDRNVAGAGSPHLENNGEFVVMSINRRNL